MFIESNTKTPTSPSEINNLFPAGKERSTSSQRRDLDLSTTLKCLCTVTIGAIAIAAFAAYYNQDNSQNLYERLQNQANNGRFDGITQEQMESHYNIGKRSLTAQEGRDLYKKINALNLELAQKALDNKGYPDKIAMSACKTRHAARVFVRELAPEAYQKYAENRDLKAFGSKTGLNCNQVWDKYNGDPAKIIAAAGRDNSDMTFFVKNAPEPVLNFIVNWQNTPSTASAVTR